MDVVCNYFRLTHECESLSISIHREKLNSLIISNNNNGIIRKINKKILLNIKLNKRLSLLKPIYVNLLINIHYIYLLTNIMFKIRLQMFSYRFLTNTLKYYNNLCIIVFVYILYYY